MSRLAKSLFSIPAKSAAIQQASKNWSSVSSIALEESLFNIPPTKTTILDNGMKVATEDQGGPTATVGIYIDAGSRYENGNNNGVAHFLEHMAFKGTDKRSRTDLELEIENMGAHLNAYTSREQTVYYAKCFSKDVPQAVDILSDIISNSKLTEADIERERGVILREMEEVENNMQEVVFDHLHSTAFMGTTLGNTILGSPRNVRSLQKSDLQEYIKNHYKPHRMVIAGAGGVDHDQLVKLAEQCFPVKEHYADKLTETKLPYCRYTGSELLFRDDSMPFCYLTLALRGVGWTDRLNLPLMVASTLIGSWDRTVAGGIYKANRLVSKCVEYGIGQSFQSFNTCYKDTGLWGCYAVVDKMNVGRFVHYLQDEWMRLVHRLVDEEVERAKNDLKTHMVLQLDGTTPVCEDIGRQMLCYGRRIPIHELIGRLDAISTEDVRDACDFIINDRCPVIAAVGPTEAVPEYHKMRAALYWLRV